MNIAMLNERVTFQKNEVVTDRIGNHTNAWTEYYTCSATISGENGREEADAGQTTEHPDMNVTIRWCQKAAAITEDGYRIVFRGELYNIIGIDHFSYKKEALKFRCRKAAR
jgi:SPP1 family predicted phage head-tail adaptor